MSYDRKSLRWSTIAELRYTGKNKLVLLCNHNIRRTKLITARAVNSEKFMKSYSIVQAVMRKSSLKRLSKLNMKLDNSKAR